MFLAFTNRQISSSWDKYRKFFKLHFFRFFLPQHHCVTLPILGIGFKGGDQTFFWVLESAKDPNQSLLFFYCDVSDGSGKKKIGFTSIQKAVLQISGLKIWFTLPDNASLIGDTCYWQRSSYLIVGPFTDDGWPGKIPQTGHIIIIIMIGQPFFSLNGSAS